MISLETNPIDTNEYALFNAYEVDGKTELMYTIPAGDTPGIV